LKKNLLLKNVQSYHIQFAQLEQHARRILLDSKVLHYWILSLVMTMMKHKVQHVHLKNLVKINLLEEKNVQRNFAEEYAKIRLFL
jgi:hypothetical protein